MNEPQAPIDPGLDLGRLLGQRRVFAAVGGRCSAAHAQLLRRIHDEKLYLAIAPSWRAFCGTYLAITAATPTVSSHSSIASAPPILKSPNSLASRPGSISPSNPSSVNTISSSTPRLSASSPRMRRRFSKPSASFSVKLAAPGDPRRSREPAQPRRRSRQPRTGHRQSTRRPLQFRPLSTRPRIHSRNRHRNPHDPHAARPRLAPVPVPYAAPRRRML